MGEPVTLTCAVIDDDSMSRAIIEKYISRVDFLEFIQSFSNPTEAVERLLELQDSGQGVDLIFLDIEMPEMSGIDFIKYSRINAQIVLVSTESIHAAEAFELDATDYIVKPLTFARFLKASTKAKDYRQTEIQLSQNPVMAVPSMLNHSPLNDVLFIRYNSRYIKIPTKEILWIEAIGDYVEIHTTGKKYTVHATMKFIENKLVNTEFLRVHRSYIINITRITEIEDNTLVLDKKLVPIGKSYRDKLLASLKLI
jgi:DNA-binding LytR/AlgR family response regulator